MAATIRRATPQDAPQWLNLVQSVLGPEYPSKEIYDPAWIAAQLDPGTGSETWVADTGTQLNASVSILKTRSNDSGAVANLGRNLNRPESFDDGSTELLLRKIDEFAQTRNQMVVIRVSILDNRQQ